MLDLVCKSQKGNAFFYQKEKKKKNSLFSDPDSTGSAVQMRCITFKAGCNPGSIISRKNESTGAWELSVRAGWHCALFSSVKSKRKEKEVVCLCSQVLHTCAPVLS